jgi:hypothetical protein
MANQMTYIRSLNGEGRNQATLKISIPNEVKLQLHWQLDDTIEMFIQGNALVVRKVEDNG